MKKLLTILFISFILFKVSFGQNDFYTNDSVDLQHYILSSVQKAKARMACDYVITKGNDAIGILNCNPIDTTLYEYIPIISRYSWFTEHEIATKNELPYISEILLFNKQYRKIIGSCLFCRDGSISFVFVRSKFGIGTMPCQSHNQFSYIDIRCYRLITKLLKRANIDKLYLSADTGSLYYILDHTQTRIDCPQ